MNIERELNAYLKDKGIKISTISERTGISENVLYPSLNGKRELRAKEFFAICKHLNVDPKQFVALDADQKTAS